MALLARPGVAGRTRDRHRRHQPALDDTGVTALALLATSAVFGIVQPRRPWVWALAVGIWIPLLNIVQTHNVSSILALVFPFAGAYAAAFGRRLITHMA